MTKELQERIGRDAIATFDKGPAHTTFVGVFWSYRLLLQRDPEFVNVASYQRQCLLDRWGFVKSFIDPTEFPWKHSGSR